MRRIPDFTRAFCDGATAREPDGTQAIIAVHSVGKLAMPSGRIVACDPFCCPNTEPFSVTVPPERYPVLLSVAHFYDSPKPWYKGSRIAYTMLRFSERESVRWEMALLPGQDTSELEENGIFGYPVDAGTGCFMDTEAARALAKRISEDRAYVDELVLSFHSLRQFNGQRWMSILPDRGSKANVVMFDSGWGDDLYASYFGYDAAGSPTSLVTNFKVLDDDATFE